jgi:protein arginine N-methyltransferase 1
MLKGPHAKYTHWKQTVFYLNEVLMLSPGDVVTGTLSAKPNSKNPRDMDIVITYEFKGKFNDVSVRQEFFLR